jgi:hypothetical protein
MSRLLYIDELKLQQSPHRVFTIRLRPRWSRKTFTILLSANSVYVGLGGEFQYVSVIFNSEGRPFDTEFLIQLSSLLHLTCETENALVISLRCPIFNAKKHIAHMRRFKNNC